MRRRWIRWTLRAGLATILLPASFVAARWGTGNFGTVSPGRVYRAAQPTPDAIAGAIRRHGIKTVLNLRGRNPDRPWYVAERGAALGAGAVQVDFPMSSDQWLSHDQVRTLLSILDDCSYPILIHCEWGAERTGLVSAFCELLREGSSVERARREFSAYYLFLPMKDGLVMRGHLDAYASWLATSGRGHSPGAFRRWLTRDYRPGSPSREYWPCNPYPLKVVSRPGAGPVALWGGNACPKVIR